MKRFWIIGLILLALIILLPVLIWHIEPGKECRMAIIDIVGA
ncbi:MAG: hypothetical protein ACOX4A_08505 [Saccharofermentanales bacterium]